MRGLVKKRIAPQRAACQECAKILNDFAHCEEQNLAEQEFARKESLVEKRYDAHMRNFHGMTR